MGTARYIKWVGCMRLVIIADGWGAHATRAHARACVSETT
jgi:hypothetical protein